MVSFDLPETPHSRVSPALLVGVASPLWAYFGAAAAGGVAYWWMTQWARPVNLEALVGAAVPAPAAVEPVLEAVVEAISPPVAAFVEDLPTVGGEAAPISPLVEAASEPLSEPLSEPPVAPLAPPEPVLDAAPGPVIEEPAPVFSEAAPKSRVKKAPIIKPEA